MRKVVLLILLAGLFESAFAGAWTLKKGDLRVKQSVFYQKTDERYYSRITPCPLDEDCSNFTGGERIKFDFEGESKSTAIYLDLTYGLLNNLELNAQIPYFDIMFTNLGNPDRPANTGIGDIRFGAKYKFLQNPVVAALKINAKAPTGFFNKDAEAVPIGDGQWDLEFVGQLGKSLWPLPGYLNVDAGYRIRFAPDPKTTTREPGNEFFFRAEAGFDILKPLLVKVAVNGLYGERFIIDGFEFSDSQREILLIEPGLYWHPNSRIALEASINFSLSGKNYTAGQIYSFGASYTFSLIK